jgi:hypothetical protein
MVPPYALYLLLPELEVMVARERDRQRLLSTPIGTPRHTVKKTYVDQRGHLNSNLRF